MISRLPILRRHGGGFLVPVEIEGMDRLWSAHPGNSMVGCCMALCQMTRIRIIYVQSKSSFLIIVPRSGDCPSIPVLGISCD
jgi:hypothetical protein